MPAAASHSQQTSQGEHRELVRLARGGVVNLAGGIAAAGFGFAFAVVVARGLGVSDAGLFFGVTALSLMLTTFAQLGTTGGVVRMIASYLATGHEQDVRRTLTVALVPVVGVSLVLAAALGASAPLVARTLFQSANQHVAVEFLRITAAFLVVEATFGVLLRACQAFGAMLPLVALGSIGVPVARFVGGLAAVAVGLGPTTMILVWFVPEIVGLAVASEWLRRLVRSAEPDRARAAAARPHRELGLEFWHYTVYQAFSTVVAIILLRLDVILLGALDSSQAAAVYSAAGRYLVAGTTLLTAIVFVVGPQLAGMLSQERYSAARLVYQTATLWLVAVSFPVFLTLATFAPVLMSVFGPRFLEGQTALTILALAMLVNMGTGAVRAALSMGGRSGWVFMDNLAALAVNVGLNVVLIPRMGMDGAAIAWAASIVVGNLLPLGQVFRLWGLQPVSAGGLRVVVATGLYGAVCILVRGVAGASPGSMIAATVAGLAVYGAALWLIRDDLRAHVFREALRVRRVRRAAQAEGA
jgi:O-antigen/teichoic acid export membrane protein